MIDTLLDQKKVKWDRRPTDAWRNPANDNCAPTNWDWTTTPETIHYRLLSLPKILHWIKKKNKTHKTQTSDDRNRKANRWELGMLSRKYMFEGSSKTIITERKKHPNGAESRQSPIVLHFDENCPVATSWCNVCLRPTQTLYKVIEFEGVWSHVKFKARRQFSPPFLPLRSYLLDILQNAPSYFIV